MFRSWLTDWEQIDPSRMFDLFHELKMQLNQDKTPLSHFMRSSLKINKQQNWLTVQSMYNLSSSTWSASPSSSGLSRSSSVQAALWAWPDSASRTTSRTGDTSRITERSTSRYRRILIRSGQDDKISCVLLHVDMNCNEMKITQQLVFLLSSCFALYVNFNRYSSIVPVFDFRHDYESGYYDEFLFGKPDMLR